MKNYHTKSHKQEDKKENIISFRHIFLDVIIVTGIMIVIVGLGLVPSIPQNLFVISSGVVLLVVCVVALYNQKALRMPKIR